LIILIKHIPLETKTDELASFINSSGISITITELVIFSLPAVDASLHDLVALIWVIPKAAGTKVIQKLNGSLFQGHIVNVCEYMLRSADNDPRKNNPNPAITFKEQRLSDRRRKPLIIPWRINSYE